MRKIKITAADKFYTALQGWKDGASCKTMDSRYLLLKEFTHVKEYYEYGYTLGLSDKNSAAKELGKIFEYNREILKGKK